MTNGNNKNFEKFLITSGYKVYPSWEIPLSAENVPSNFNLKQFETIWNNLKAHRCKDTLGVNFNSYKKTISTSLALSQDFNCNTFHSSVIGATLAWRFASTTSSDLFETIRYIGLSCAFWEHSLTLTLIWRSQYICYMIYIYIYNCSSSPLQNHHLKGKLYVVHPWGGQPDMVTY